MLAVNNGYAQNQKRYDIYQASRIVGIHAQHFADQPWNEYYTLPNKKQRA